MKQLTDRTDELEKHVEDLTWILDDVCYQQSSTLQAQASNDVQPRKKVTKSSVSASRKFNRDLCRIAEVESQHKVSLVKSKSHIFDDSHLQQTETKSSSPDKKLKLTSSPSKIAKFAKQKSTRNKSAVLSEYNISKLSGNKKLKSVETEDKSESHIEKRLDSSKPAVQLNGDRDHWSENGVVSFTDEPEVNDKFSSFSPAPLSHLEQSALYSEFESAVVDEYSDREPARNSGKLSDRRRTDRDSSDEDVFDLIATGQINKITQRSQGSRSNYNRSFVTLQQQRNSSFASLVVGHDSIVSKHCTADREGDNYDSASSADTDVIICSHRLMSEVTSSVQNQIACLSQSNPDSMLNVAGEFDSFDQLFNVAKNVSPFQSLPGDRGRKQRRKRSTGLDAEIAVKNCVHSPELKESATIVSENTIPRNLPENSHSAERKRKRKLSKADNSKVAVKNDASSTDIVSRVDACESDVLPVTTDVSDSNVKQHKTDVSSHTADCFYNVHKYWVSFSRKYLDVFACL